MNYQLAKGLCLLVFLSSRLLHSSFLTSKCRLIWATKLRNNADVAK